MDTDTPQPGWDKQKPSVSLLTYGEWLHVQAMDTFLNDKTHAYILFLFSQEEGLVSFNPIPQNATAKALLAGVRQTVLEQKLYAVITVSETWMYFPKTKNDHTLVQLMHGEMDITDLRDDDKTECLMVQMESRDGDGMVWFNWIIRDGDEVRLGDTAQFPLTKALKQDRYFGV